MELDVDNSSLNDQYFSSLYWSLTMLAKTPWIGPDTILEKVIGSLGVLLGAVLLAALLGNVQALVGGAASPAAKKRGKVSELVNLCRLHNVPQKLEDRLVDHINEHWNWMQGQDRQQILSMLPTHLRGANGCSLLRPMRQSLQNFYELNSSGVGDVVLSAGRLTRPSARCHRTLADECVARSTKGVVPLQRSQP